MQKREERYMAAWISEDRDDWFILWLTCWSFSLSPPLSIHLPCLCIDICPRWGEMEEFHDIYQLHEPDSLVLWLLVGTSQWEALADVKGHEERRMGHFSHCSLPAVCCGFDSASIPPRRLLWGGCFSLVPAFTRILQVCSLPCLLRSWYGNSFCLLLVSGASESPGGSLPAVLYRAPAYSLSCLLTLSLSRLSLLAWALTETVHLGLIIIWSHHLSSLLQQQSHHHKG